ncbi:MAG: SpoIIE family protein phosphatase [Chitinophagaceae bacterium]
MDNKTHVVFRAEDRSYFAILKKEIHALAVSAGFEDSKVGEIDIVVAELVSNLVKHAGGGQLFVKLIEDKDHDGIEIISIDNGQGMTDVSRMVADGVSTKNTLGHGLGAMKRLSDVFQVYSLKDWGTIILIRVFKEEIPPFKKPPRAEVRSLIVPKPGEKHCGDGLYYTVTSEYLKLFVGDGLGHGKPAEEAVMQAGKAFLECGENEPAEIIRYINNAVKKTRGLVGTAVVFDFKDRVWKICGVGNISTKAISADSVKNYMSYNGIIGLNVPKTLNAQELAYEKGQHLVMCSDGIKSRWDTIKQPVIFRYDLGILCASILKDFARNTDDMSVVACKINL